MSVNLDFARETLKEVENFRAKVKNINTFKYEYRDLYTEDLYYVIDSIGKDENRVEKARIQQVVRDSIEAADVEVQQLVKERLEQVNRTYIQVEPKLAKGIAVKNIAKKPWLPRVALLPSRRVALQQNKKQVEINTSIKSVQKPTTKQKTAIKSIAEILEPKEKPLRYNEIVKLQPISAPHVLTQDVSVQTKKAKFREKVIMPSRKSQNSEKKFHFQPAVLISTPVQIDRSAAILKDKTSSFNLPETKQLNIKAQNNVAVLNIIQDSYHPKQLSVQVLPSVSIECKTVQQRRTKKNVEVLIEKELDSSQSSSLSREITKPSIEVKTPEEPLKIPTSHSSTQTQSFTKTVSTSPDREDHISLKEQPVDIITVRQMLHNIICSLKGDGEFFKLNTKETESQTKLPQTFPSMESRGMSTDSWEQKSQAVSMEIETRSQGVTTNEKYSKTQETQVEIELKEFKDAITLAEDIKEVKDVATLVKDFHVKESKEIGIQTRDVVIDHKIDSQRIKVTEDKMTEMDSPIESSDSSESVELKVSQREMGVQANIQVSSSGSSLSTFNESSSVIVSSSTSTSTSTVSDEPISEGEVVFKRPFLLPPRSNRLRPHRSVELEVTEEFDEADVSISEGETNDGGINEPNEIGSFEREQSVGEIVNLNQEADLSPNCSLGSPIDGASSSSGEISHQ